MSEDVVFKTLETEPREFLYDVFMQAFADYSVPVRSSFTDFTDMHLRRGIDYTASVGAYAQGRLVGFIFNGVGEWQGQTTAYDGGTGMLPDWRGQGILKRLIAFSKDRLRGLGCRQWLLEVLQDNVKAVAAYEHAGFHRTRGLYCFERDSLPDSGIHRKAADRTKIRQEWEVVPCARQAALPEPEWLDWLPSWQNSDASILRSPEPMLCFKALASGREIGAILATAGGSICQLAVAPEYRRKGVGSALLAALSGDSPKVKIRYVNIDGADSGHRAFMLSSGFQKSASQWEMIAVL